MECRVFLGLVFKQWLSPFLVKYSVFAVFPVFDNWDTWASVARTSGRYYTTAEIEGLHAPLVIGIWLKASVFGIYPIRKTCKHPRRAYCLFAFLTEVVIREGR